MHKDFPEYPKIYGPYKRATEGPNRNKVIPGEWSKPEFALLADLDWIWTEKVDGTNIRVGWDGHKVTYGGRTDNAQIPAKLIQALNELFAEELFEQAFGDQPAVLYGEGYGAGIQKGGAYRDDMSFVLFDVRVGRWWLLRDKVEEIAEKLGIDVVPVRLTGSVDDAIAKVWDSMKSRWGDFKAEGLVGRVPCGLLSRDGQPLFMKVKASDYELAG